jgi:peptidyl-prolyl cis-trans isomerase SurA
MTFWKQCAAGALWSIIAATMANASGQIVDRMIANVNGHVVLQSDWEEEMAFESFVNGRTVDSFTSEERKAALDRLIDQELLREQVRPSEAAPRAEIAVRVSEIRKLHAEAATEEGWIAALRHCGLTQAELEMHVGESIQLMRMVEARLRPSIQIDQKAVESYYNEQLLPELKKSGGREVALPEVFGHIRDLLAEQRLNQLLHGWLENLRSSSHILTARPPSGDQTP